MTFTVCFMVWTMFGVSFIPFDRDGQPMLFH